MNSKFQAYFFDKVCSADLNANSDLRGRTLAQKFLHGLCAHSKNQPWASRPRFGASYGGKKDLPHERNSQRLHHNIKREFGQIVFGLFLDKRASLTTSLYDLYSLKVEFCSENRKFGVMKKHQEECPNSLGKKQTFLVTDSAFNGTFSLKR